MGPRTRPPALAPPRAGRIETGETRVQSRTWAAPWSPGDRLMITGTPPSYGGHAEETRAAQPRHKKEKPAVWVPTQPVRNSLLSRHKRAARRRALRFTASELRSNMLVAGWAARLPQPAPVQTPVLDRLAHVLRLELGRAAQVRDRPRDLENPVVRPRREREPGDRGTEQRVGALRHAAERPDVACRHVRVRIDPGPAGESLPLHHTRAIHPLPHRRARLAPALIRERAVLHRRHLEVDVDPVEQRTRDAGEIALDAERPADAIVLGIAEVAAGTGIHGRGEHEASGVAEAHRRPRDRHDAVLHRLAQHLERSEEHTSELQSQSNLVCR